LAPVQVTVLAGQLQLPELSQTCPSGQHTDVVWPLGNFLTQTFPFLQQAPLTHCSSPLQHLVPPQTAVPLLHTHANVAFAPVPVWTHLLPSGQHLWTAPTGPQS